MKQTSAAAYGQTTKTKSRSAKGRPAQLTDSSLVTLCAAAATTKLQKNSDRRAVVQFLVDNGGKAKVRDINKRFDFDTKPIVQALLYAGWVTTE